MNGQGSIPPTAGGIQLAVINTQASDFPPELASSEALGGAATPPGRLLHFPLSRRLAPAVPAPAGRSALGALRPQLSTPPWLWADILFGLREAAAELITAAILLGLLIPWWVGAIVMLHALIFGRLP